MAYRNKNKSAEKAKITRIAVVNPEKCKPKNCGQVCKKYCPVEKMGKVCITVEVTSKTADISQTQCNGCGICPKKCPYNAIRMVNLPTNMDFQTTHRFGPNSFKLHRIPMPKFGRVLGLVGANGTGKTTALKILSGKVKPNLGNFEDPPSWPEIVKYFRGSSLQNYFKEVAEEKWKPVLKPQYLDQIRNHIGNETPRQVLSHKDERGKMEEISTQLGVDVFLDRQIQHLSGGELQRFAIAVVCVQNADIYMFDEPSSYLDVRQRLRVAAAIREQLTYENQVLIVEHDLALLDYLSDFICCLYGEPGAYGIVTHPLQVREGLNQFLDGFFTKENVRFRDYALEFQVKTEDRPGDGKHENDDVIYPAMTKTFDGFNLKIESGSFNTSEIVVMLGENGTGKSTFIEILAGNLDPDIKVDLPKLSTSYKPQRVLLEFEGSVRQLLQDKLQGILADPTFRTDVLKPLKVHDLLDYQVNNLSGGEQQRVALTLCLGTPADVYLIDEPSAFLDSEQRLAAAKVIKRAILSNKKSAFVVEHDFIMATYLADRVIVFQGEPSKTSTASKPSAMVEGVNKFLESLDVTFYQDRKTGRPRINKPGCLADREQKKAGRYYFLEQ